MCSVFSVYVIYLKLETFILNCFNENCCEIQSWYCKLLKLRLRYFCFEIVCCLVDLNSVGWDEVTVLIIIPFANFKCLACFDIRSNNFRLNIKRNLIFSHRFVNVHVINLAAQNETRHQTIPIEAKENSTLTTIGLSILVCDVSHVMCAQTLNEIGIEKNKTKKKVSNRIKEKNKFQVKKYTKNAQNSLRLPRRRRIESKLSKIE